MADENTAVAGDEVAEQEIVSHQVTGDSKAQSMNDLLESGAEIRVLKPGDMVEGTMISVSKNEVYIDLAGYGVGVVRGRELYDDQATLNSLKPGDKITASVVETENREGNVELSLRVAGQERVWQKLRDFMESKEIVSTKILAANKGGLMIELNNVTGFLPVSQLSLEHYPRVEDGDKNKILSILNSYVGTNFSVQVITADMNEEKLIVSEKAVHEEEMHSKMSELKIGDIVTGNITGVVDFGVFVKFGELEGLVHISELAWQRIENPKDLFKVGDVVKAKIIAIEKGRVSLSIKQLQNDPWAEAVKKYQIGQVVKGTISKIMPFGVFVELDKDIQGLAHLIELSHEPVKQAEDVVKIGQEAEFKVISIEPGEHRLGLSIKQLTEAPKKSEAKTEETPAAEAAEVAEATEVVEEKTE
ncbi:MAG TPA: S1 RNA-binding domain-containing protein [Patescibacteria group bacterium]|nr:S1 RNA-binding domain-containing protein [Patescibacteria group bacterium]